MAIDARCPFCSKAYRLKDDLVGKKVTCANSDCRKVFPVVAITNAPVMDAESTAMAVLSDVPAVETPVESRMVAMTCVMCDHKWEAPWDMQGKNVLCPECKHRQKVPEQKSNKPADWRTGGGGPSLAKKETLEGVTSARDTSMVSGDTLLKTGVIDDGVEPVPLKVKLQRWGGAALALGLVVGLVLYYLSTRRESRANTEFSDLSRAAEREDFATLPLHRALLRMASAEYAVRKNTDKQLTMAIELYTKALNDLRTAPRGADRDCLTGELALSMLNLGGEGEFVIDKKRIPWVPVAPKGRVQIGNNSAEEQGVHRQIQHVLRVMKESGSDFEVRAFTARRLARALIPLGQIDVLLKNVDAGFNEKERYEALGQIGLELLRANQTDAAKLVAKDLVDLLGTNPEAVPYPGSAQALWNILEIKGPIPAITETSGTPNDAVRQTITAQHLVKKDAAAALAMATRPGSVESRLRALTTGAELAEAPEPFLEAADKVLSDPRSENASLPSPYLLLRLSTIAARVGDSERSLRFTKAIADLPLRTYATAEALRASMQSHKTQIMPDTDAVLPADVNAKDYLLGHAWGRFQLARHNGYNSNATKAKEYATTWPKPLVAPFGEVGAMLGVQDQKATP